MTSNCLFYFRCHKAMHTHIERERERERGRALRNMDVQTHARQGPAHVRTDVVHGEAPCITRTRGRSVPPGVKRGCAAPHCQHQPQGSACAPGCEQGTRFCLPLTRGRSRQRVAGDRFAEPFENLMEREKTKPPAVPGCVPAPPQTARSKQPGERACEEAPPPQSHPFSPLRNRSHSLSHQLG